MKRPKIIDGGLAIDNRGEVRFVNDFDFKDVKRFYQVENFSKNTIRAFHGHLKEEKFIYLTSGSVLIALVKLNRVKNPNKSAKVYRFVLSSKKPQVLYVPGKYANGFKVLENGTKLIIFSTSSLKQSLRDDFRYPYDYWGKDIWKVENR